MLVKLQRSKREKDPYSSKHRDLTNYKGMSFLTFTETEYWNAMLFGVGCRSTMQAMLIIDGMGQEKGTSISDAFFS